jgi:hypothetical protein
MMTTILHYRDFWDVPRMFFVRHRDQLLLFNCPFDEQAEDFLDEYRVSTMPELTEAELGGSWVDLPQRAIQHLGAIPITRVNFDPTRRNSIETRLLDELLAGAHNGPLSRVPIRR